MESVGRRGDLKEAAPRVVPTFGRLERIIFRCRQCGLCDNAHKRFGADHAEGRPRSSRRRILPRLVLGSGPVRNSTILGTL